MSVSVMIFRMSIIITVVESIIMFSLPLLSPDFHAVASRYGWLLPALDAVVLVTFCTPLIYYWVARPFVLERDRAEALLLEKNERFIEAQRVGHIGLWELDLRDDSLEWSDESYRIFEMDRSQLAGSTAAFYDTVHPEDREKLRAAYSGSLVSRTPYIHTHRILLKDGRVKWVEERCGTEFDADGKPVRSIGTVQDITDRMALDTAKNEFLSLISHELRTPLTSIKGSLGLVAGGAAGDIPDKARAMLDIARNNSDRLEALINDILDVEKLESGKMNFRMESVDLAALIKDAIVANKGYGDQYGISFNERGLDEPVFVNADKDRLMQVMANLMSNAAKFSATGGQVEISLDADASNARVSVRDYGAGIPEEARETLFDRFVQADSSDSRQKGGTGLGLGIAKMIVDKHGGTIGLTSEVGNGTTFYFDLKRELHE